MQTEQSKAGRKRVVIQDVRPQVACGRYAVKRVVGQKLVVDADAFADGHEAVRLRLAVWPPRIGAEPEEVEPEEREMEPLGNDEWRASVLVTEIGLYRYTVRGWVDSSRSWRAGLKKKVDAEMDVSVELLIGARLVLAAASRAEAGGDSRSATVLRAAADGMADSSVPAARRAVAALDESLAALVDEWPDRENQTEYRHLKLRVDREKAAFSAWYEMFPRSAARSGHGTFKDTVKLLPYIKKMGFDVLYLPPIHPIGVSKRKGKNNALEAGPDDPGSPWAIGGKEGGHTAIHPQLGTDKDFRALVAEAGKRQIEVALDLAFQCSPDHPWVTEHPSWFVHRPDGSVQYAENPPKKYEDIYPINFDSEDWQELWTALVGVFEHWIERGVHIFRVDNPHTKSLHFWEWAIADINSRHPEVLFLAEAFTRPKVMYQLAMAGFSQSYTYFTWRNTAEEMRAYLEELKAPPVRDFFRPNFWPNTPDILHEDLQTGGKAAFIVRLVLAATLSGNYGIYGPAFEQMKHVPRNKGSEEYLNSEKYEIKVWDREDPSSLAGTIARVNEVRRRFGAFGPSSVLRFHDTDNRNILCYSRTDPGGGDPVLVVASFDYAYGQSGWVDFSLPRIGVHRNTPFSVTDLMTEETYTWDNAWNFVALSPPDKPVHIFQIHLPPEA